MMTKIGLLQLFATFHFFTNVFKFEITVYLSCLSKQSLFLEIDG